MSAAQEEESFHLVARSDPAPRARVAVKGALSPSRRDDGRPDNRDEEDEQPREADSEQASPPGRRLAEKEDGKGVD
jgi:hypothetical protein